MTKALARTRAGRRDVQKAKAAARARSYRVRQMAKRIPAAGAIDRAIAEAVAFHVMRDGVNVGAWQRPADILTTARLCLEREGYDPEKSARAIAKRMKRDEHTWPHFVPSLKPAPLSKWCEPKGDAGWRTPKEVIAQHVVRPGRAIPEYQDTPVTPSNSVTGVA